MGVDIGATLVPHFAGCKILRALSLNERYFLFSIKNKKCHLFWVKNRKCIVVIYIDLLHFGEIK